MKNKKKSGGGCLSMIGLAIGCPFVITLIAVFNDELGLPAWLKMFLEMFFDLLDDLYIADLFIMASPWLAILGVILISVNQMMKIKRKSGGVCLKMIGIAIGCPVVLKLIVVFSYEVGFGMPARLVEFFLMTSPWLTILGVILIVVGVSKRKTRIRIEREHIRIEREKNDLLDIIKQLEELMDSYSDKSNLTVEETKTAWIKYNDTIRLMGINHINDDAVYHVYSGIGVFLRRKTDDEFAKTIQNKLWDFYYQIAYRYELDAESQKALLSYLFELFRADREKNNYRYYGDYCWNGYSNLPYAYNDWNAKLLKLIEEGCRKEIPYAIHLLAHCYYEREVVELRDYDKAFALYQQAAQLGDIQSVYMMGRCYEKGNGTKKNPQKAGDCYQYAYDYSKDAKYADALDKLYTAQKWDKNRYSPDIFVNNTAVLKKDNLGAIREKLEKYARTDLATAELRVLAVSVGMLQEDIVNSYISCFERSARDDEMYQKIDLLRNKDYFTMEIADKAHFVRKLRNHAAHEGNQNEPITVENVRTQILYVQDIVEYYAAY